MTQHLHPVSVPGCYRCDLSSDEAMHNMVPIEVWGFRCERCEHQWAPRAGFVKATEPEPSFAPPKVCPRCKSPYWDIPRKVAND